MTSGFIGAALLCLLAGVGIPILASMNGALTGRLGLAAASFILFGVGFATVGAFHLITAKPQPLDFSHVPIYLFFAGSLMAFYILTISTMGPRIGITTAITFVLAGQIISAALIDHFGAFGMPKVSFGMQRLAGLLLIMGGIYLARRPG